MRRAILNKGDISSFADIYSEALGGSPLPIVSQFDSFLRLPSPNLLIERFDKDLAHALPNQDEEPVCPEWAQCDLRIIPPPQPGENAAECVSERIAEFDPDIIALACAPAELSTHFLYAFSMACAVGLACQFEMVVGDSIDAQFDGTFEPGSTGESLVIESWLRKIPLVPLGKPSTALSQFDPKGTFYVAGRIVDVLRSCRKSKGRNRLLAVVDGASCQEVARLVEMARRNDAEYLYLQAEPDSRCDDSFLIGAVVETALAHDCDISRLSTAQRIFLSAFEPRTKLMATEVLPSPAVNELLAEIVNRVRSHPDIDRGPSVRGTIAFSDILNGLASLDSGVTRDKVGKAALISLTPRVTARQRGNEASLISDIVKEVLYGFRFCGVERTSYRSDSTQMAGSDTLATENQLRHAEHESPNTTQMESFAVVPETDLKNERPAISSGRANQTEKQRQDAVMALKKAVMSLLSDLENQLRAGTLSAGQYEKHKAALMSKLKDAVASRSRMTDGELASTIVEMMDAQDKQWAKEVSFSRMQVYYHIKGTCEKSELSPFKQDYHTLKWLIDDLDRDGILEPASESAGFFLTGFALDVLLKYLIGKDGSNHRVSGFTGPGPVLTDARSTELRRYSRGDTFRDLSIRHTIKHVARHGKRLSEIRRGDLRVFLKQRQMPRSDTIFCIDTSGSMGFDQKLTYARVTAAGLVEAALRERNRAGVVAFSDYGRTLIGITGEDSHSLMRGIAGLRAGGNTNIGDGMKSARQMLLQSHRRNLKQIVLLSDGQPSAISEEAFSTLRSNTSADLAEAAALQEAEKAAASGIQVSVIYIAPRYEAVDLFIQNIARIGRGRVYRVSGFGDLKAMLRDQPTAINVTAYDGGLDWL